MVHGLPRGHVVAQPTRYSDNSRKRPFDTTQVTGIGQRTSQMARLVEDSDDEFPELAVIIGKYRSSANYKTAGKDQLQPLTEKPIRTKAVAVSTAGDPRTSSNKFTTAILGIERPNSKRRFLNELCDNPLLQSCSSLNERTPIHRSLCRAELQKKMQFTVSGAQETSTPTSCPGLGSSLEENDLSIASSTGLSDFIVNDSSFLEEDSIDEVILQRAPASTRRLCRGRRFPEGDTDGQNWSDSVKFCGIPKGITAFIGDNTSLTKKNELGKFADISINASPNAILEDAGLVTSPPSPSRTQRGLLPLRKGQPIPETPHRPSMDAFWDPGVINEWNEECSPQKPVIPQNHLVNDKLEVGFPCSPEKKSQILLDKSKIKAKNSFTLRRHDIADAFLRELDESITSGKIAEMAALTGGISIIWSKKLNTTAGRANWRREAIKATARDVDGKLDTNVTYRHYASIELAEKVIKDEERLLNVIAHEFCHLANFMISGIRNNPHGKDFKIWASKCSKQFGSRGIKVTTKHSYEIDYKYVWECTNCGTEFKRHSKSIDPLKHRCGSCKSELVQMKPVPRSKTGMSEYQLFVKENMRKVKEQNPGSPQKQIMIRVGKMYQDFKASKPSSLKEDMDKVELSDGNKLGSREEPSSEGDVDSIMRKLNFLDLTSPCIDFL